MRIGAKKRPFYRVVVVDERAKRTGGYIELLGTYNPLTEPKDIKLKQDRIDYWIKQGAQPSDGYLRMIGKAPQRPPRKPKKEKKAEQPSAISPQPSEEKPVEQPGEEQAPAKQPEEQKEKSENVIPTPSEVEGEGSSTSSNNPTTEDSSSTSSPQNDKEKKTK